MKRFATALICFACCFALMFAMTGCAQKNADTEKATANRAYMSQLNTAVEDMNANLNKFTEAVASSDLITMRSVAKKVSAQIEDIRDMKVPDDLKEVSKQYLSGLDSLNDALKAYINLYSDIDAGKVSSAAEQLSAIQKTYDAGIKALKAADEAASKL